jgi:hypothetical protein
MADRLLLVHSPLTGPQTWDTVAPYLAEPGRPVVVPDLTATVAAGPPYCQRQIELIARGAEGQPAVLVGHSGAGPLLAAAGALAGRVEGYVFVDARLPRPGKAWTETAPPDLVARLREMAGAEGWLPPWPQWWGEEAMAELVPDPAARARFAAGCPPLPMAMFEETYPPAPGWPEGPEGPAAPCAYLQLSEAYEAEAARAADLGWPVARLTSHHLAPLTDPAGVAAAVRHLLRQK